MIKISRMVIGLMFLLAIADVTHADEGAGPMSLSDIDAEDYYSIAWTESMLFPYASLWKSSNMEVQVGNNTGERGYNVNGTNRHKGLYLKHLNLYSKGQVRYLPLVMTPIIIVIGIVGNIISFFVLLKFTRAQKFSSDFHLCTLAVFDTGGLLFSSFPFWANTFLRADLGMRGMTSPFQRMLGEYGACHFWFYLSFNFRYLSHWTIVIFSLERYLIISRPFEASTRFTIKRAAISTAILAFVTFVCNIHIFFMFDKGILPGGATICKWRPIFFKANFVHLFFMAFIPSVLIITFNSLIIRALMKHRQADPRVVSESDGKSRESQVTRRVVAVSAGFVILTMPFMVVAYYRNIRTLQGQTDFPVLAADLFAFCLSLYLVNYACNFVLYCVTGERFREAVRELFRCGGKKGKDELDTSGRRTSSTLLSPDKRSLDGSNKVNIEAIPLTQPDSMKEYHSSV